MPLTIDKKANDLLKDGLFVKKNIYIQIIFRLNKRYALYFHLLSLSNITLLITEMCRNVYLFSNNFMSIE